MLGQRSRLPGAGARRRAGERLERLDPADAAARGSWPGPTERLAPRTRLDVPWGQPKLRCAAARHANDGDMSQRPKERSAKEADRDAEGDRGRVDDPGRG